MLGCLVLAGCVAGGVSLLTWSASDPSLTHATSSLTRNVLGPIGAIVADLTMQMLGLAGVVLLLPPLFWALQLVTARRLETARWKLVLAPLAVLLIAGALSALPSAATWPLHHGYGGMLGDFGLALFSSLLALLNPDRSSTVAGLFCFAAGMLMLMSSLGLSQQDLKLICQPGVGSGVRGIAGRCRGLIDFASGRFQAMQSPPAPAMGSIVREPPVLQSPPPPMLTDDDDDPEIAQPLHLAPAVIESGRGPVFDDVTDVSSRKIAERFAPGGKAAREPAAAPELIDAPTAGPSAVEPGHDMAWRRPPLNMLKRPSAAKAAEISQGALRGQARLLEDVLGDFGIKGEVKAIHPGPVVTLHEFEPARGVKSARVIGVADDIARSMSAASARVAVVPGRNAIGVELPNARRDKVNLRELLEADAFGASDAALPLALGKSISGAPVIADLARMPHLLVAGTTGAGKSVGINAMILSLLYRLAPDQCRLLLIDPKMLELSVYNGIPHLMCPVVTEPDKAVAALNWVLAEMEDRYRRMSRLSVRNIDAFNNRARHARNRAEPGAHDDDMAPMPYVVVVVDEFADLMIVAGKELEAAVQRLAQMARAAGIHLIMATQRPSVDVITGTIKANFPTRISFKVASKFDSRTILNEQGAEQLLGQGDLLFSNGSGRTMRVHGPFVSDEEVEAIAAYLRAQSAPRYVAGITDTPAQEPLVKPGQRAGADDLFQRAVAIVINDGKASASYLQRRLAIGYNRAADLIERMERQHIIGPSGHNGRRPILGPGGTDRGGR